MERVPTLDVERLAPQLAEARDAPDVGRDAESLLEQVGRGEHLAQDRARAEQLHANLAFPASLQRVHAAQDAFLGARRQRRMSVVLVHHADVIEDVFLLGAHSPQTVLDDDRKLVAVARVVRAAIRNRRREQLAVAVLVLQPLARERGTPRSAADEKAARAACRRRPMRNRRSAESRTSSSRYRKESSARRDSSTTCPPRSKSSTQPPSLMPSSRICPSCPRGRT